MAKRLLVTGYGGFVAGSVVKQARPEWDVTALSRKLVSDGRDDIRTLQLDIREAGQLRHVFESWRPTALIHAAAVANIDYCQSHQEEALAVNAEATRHLAELCRQHGARMVFCSTDSIFEGQRGMYVESDAPHPLNYYAETKVHAEQIVLAELENAVVARLSLVMGFPLIGGGNSFMSNMLASFREGVPVTMPENEIRTPIDVITLGQALLELAASRFRGILHLAGNTRINRYDMGIQIATRLGFAPELVRPTNSNAIPGRAPRPNDASLDNSQARHVLKSPLLNLADGLDLVLQTARK
jgi:dTDP-4-dehydrorhamnose reductase